MGRLAKYPDSFRRDAVALVGSSGRPIAEVARSLGLMRAHCGTGSAHRVSPNKNLIRVV
jgi:Transposase